MSPLSPRLLRVPCSEDVDITSPLKLVLKECYDSKLVTNESKLVNTVLVDVELFWLL